MSTFNDIKINTPGGTLYTTSSSTSTTGGTTVSGALSSSDCQSCLESIILSNIGTGSPVYQGKGTYNVFNLRTLVAGEGASIVYDDSTITIGLDNSGGSSATNLSDLLDVSVNNSSTEKGQVLTWNGSKWDAETPTGGTASQNLSDLLDVSVDDSSTTKGQVLTWNGSKWDAETPSNGGGSTAPVGTSTMYVFHLPIVVAAGVAGVTGFGTLPEGWTATVTDPSTQQYNITVTHNTGLNPLSLVSTMQNVLTPSVNNVMILGTNTTSTAYITFAQDSNSFTIYNASTSNIKMSPNPDVEQTATLHIMMA